MLVAPSPNSQLYVYGPVPPAAKPLKLIAVSVVPEYGPFASAFKGTVLIVTVAVSVSDNLASSVTVRVAV